MPQRAPSGAARLVTPGLYAKISDFRWPLGSVRIRGKPALAALLRNRPYVPDGCTRVAEIVTGGTMMLVQLLLSSFLAAADAQHDHQTSRERPVTLVAGMRGVHHRIRTKSAEAQRFFD